MLRVVYFWLNVEISKVCVQSTVEIVEHTIMESKEFFLMIDLNKEKWNSFN